VERGRCEGDESTIPQDLTRGLVALLADRSDFTIAPKDGPKGPMACEEIPDEEASSEGITILFIDEEVTRL